LAQSWPDGPDIADRSILFAAGDDLILIKSPQLHEG